MKNHNLMFLAYSLIIACFSSNFLLSTAQNVSAPVLDTAGQELRQGVNYYILPAKGGNGGGLTLANGKNDSCPYEIVQELNEGANGIPLRFSPVDANDTIIRVATDLNIKFINFSSSLVCPQSNVWTLDANRQFVTTGGVEGNPGPQTISNWFKILKYEDAYQLQYCPSVSTCGNPCGILLLCENIGILVDNGRRRLALNQSPFKIVFKTA
ncbi:hypothetical protein ACH5RR_025136 [Cinchona calisaya]|uniref:Uncharacterized protein n=1 Tax=Cinchona calisaya TaxID=153742 RepID=A0ABD2YZU0_9GENT